MNFSIMKVRSLRRVPSILALFVLASAWTGRSARAQSGVQPAGVDIGVGAMVGRGEGFRNVGVAGNALMSWYVMQSAQHGILLAAEGSGHSSIKNAIDCVVTTSDTCSTRYPSGWALAGLLGFERRSQPGAAALRVMVGPTLLFGQHDSNVGLEARVSLASPAIGRVAIVGWAEGVVPSNDGWSRSIATFGLGVRVR